MIIRDILNKIFWDPKENRLDYELVYIHRGAYMDQRRIPLSLIKEVKSSWFTYDSEAEGEVVIPFHRILEIINVKTGETIWRKSNRSKTTHAA